MEENNQQTKTQTDNIGQVEAEAEVRQPFKRGDRVKFYCDFYNRSGIIRVFKNELATIISKKYILYVSLRTDKRRHYPIHDVPVEFLEKVA